MHVRTLLASIGCLLASASVGAAQPATAAAAPAFATPAEVFAAAQQAKGSPDGLDCFTPDAQIRMAGSIVTIIVKARPTTLPAVVQASKAEFEAAWGLDRRDPRPGESDEQRVARLLDQIPDKRAFLTDFHRRQKATAAARPAPLPSTRPASVLEDVRISPDGITATGRLVRRDGPSTVSQDVKFRKIGDSWRIDQAAVMY